MANKIWIDGSGWNGRVSKYCIVFNDGRIIKRELEEERTNNEMEYMALLKALELCEEESIIYSDSRLVVEQVAGRWKIRKEHLLRYALKARNLIREKRVELKWIPREENLAGNLLEQKK